MTLKMTTAQVVETSVTVTNSSFQNYTHPDDHTTRTMYCIVLNSNSNNNNNNNNSNNNDNNNNGLLTFHWVALLC